MQINQTNVCSSEILLKISGNNYHGPKFQLTTSETRIDGTYKLRSFLSRVLKKETRSR